MPNYTNIAATAKRLVEDAGRSVTFVKQERTPTNNARPWRSVETPSNANDESTTGVAESRVTGIAVMVDPSSARNLGIMIDQSDEARRAEKVFIVAATSVNVDLAEYNQVVDGTTVWGIVQVSELKPADVSLLFYVWVRA